ncbi:hypothetical protein BD769DRAFT_1468698, partial [Suillus cothurnatus]
MPFGWSVVQVYPSVLIRTLSAACALLVCRHTFVSPGRYDADLVGEPAICGDCTMTCGTVVNLLSRSSKSLTRIGGDMQRVIFHWIIDMVFGIDST